MSNINFYNQFLSLQQTIRQCYWVYLLLHCTIHLYQVWFLDSAYKTVQAIKDFDTEELQLTVANWGEFSGRMKNACSKKTLFLMVIFIIQEINFSRIWTRLVTWPKVLRKQNLNGHVINSHEYLGAFHKIWQSTKFISQYMFEKGKLFRIIYTAVFNVFYCTQISNGQTIFKLLRLSLLNKSFLYM